MGSLVDGRIVYKLNLGQRATHPIPPTPGWEQFTCTLPVLLPTLQGIGSHLPLLVSGV